MRHTFGLLPEPFLVAGQEVLSPYALVYSGQADRWSRFATKAIIDTGSGATIAEPIFALSCGLTQDDLRSIEPERFESVGGTGDWEGIPVTLDLALVSTETTPPTSGLILRNVRVFLSERVQGVILGQHDFLERLRFEQRNYQPDRAFDLQQVELD